MKDCQLYLACLLVLQPVLSFTTPGRFGSKRVRNLRRTLRPSTHATYFSSAEAENATVSVVDSKRTPSVDDFDYNSNWYPVIWAHELVLNQPAKVTVFDVDYVVARISDTEVVALEDKCPHKAAALSQGRVTSTGKFQCAYHGWSFEGKTGNCVEIPQIVKPDGKMPPTVPSRSCAKAVPAQIHQNMVWLFPGGGLEKALVAPPPPTVSDMQENGLKMSTTMRDLPIDWPLIVSNLNDADHGLFAHQTKAFDMYSASQAHPMKVEEEFPVDGKGYILRGHVHPGDKLLEVDNDLRGIKKKAKSDEDTLQAAVFVQMPSHLQLKRHPADNDSSTFVQTFFVCPVGVGRCRVMSASFMKVAVQNWISQLFLDNFVDQDSFLVASQQKYVLQEEANDIRRMMLEENMSLEDVKQRPMTTRKKLFCLASPSDRMNAKVENFWDATLLRVPNRVETLLRMDESGALQQDLTREQVLDRKSQNFDISPSSRRVVKTCDKVVFRTMLFSFSMLAAKLCAGRVKHSQVLHSILKPWVMICSIGISTLVNILARKIKSEYFFKYTDDMWKKDLSRIPKNIWLDK